MWSVNLKRRQYFAEPGVDGRLILKWILNKKTLKLWTVFSLVHGSKKRWVVGATVMSSRNSSKANIYRSPERLWPLQKRFCSIYLCLQMPGSVGLFTLHPLLDCLLLKFKFYNIDPPARCVISDFRREVDFEFWPLNIGPIACPETSVTNYHYSLRNNPEEHSSSLERCIKTL